MRDWRGNEIKKGSIVIYPGRTGMAVWMNEGKVVGFDCDERTLQVERIAESGWRGRFEADPRVVTVFALRNVTVVGYDGS